MYTAAVATGRNQTSYLDCRPGKYSKWLQSHTCTAVTSSNATTAVTMFCKAVEKNQSVEFTLMNGILANK